MEQSPEHDHYCAICFFLIAEPVKLPCTHYYCQGCIYQWQKSNMNCPKCRQNIPLEFDNEINKKIQEDIKEKEPVEFEERLHQSQMQSEEAKKNVRIVIEYGNVHQELNRENGNSHRWQLQLKLKPENYDPYLFIHKAEFKNHPTFAQVDCKFDKNLKSKAYVGWGVFEIPITIKWKGWLEQEDTALQHQLSFQGDGKFQRFCLFVDREKLEKKQEKEKLIIKFQ